MYTLLRQCQCPGSKCNILGIRSELLSWVPDLVLVICDSELHFGDDGIEQDHLVVNAEALE